MNYEIKPEDKGFTLIYRGLEIGTAKLNCDAIFIGKQLDKLFALEYHKGAQTLERLIEQQEIDREKLKIRSEIAQKEIAERVRQLNEP